MLSLVLLEEFLVRRKNRQHVKIACKQWYSMTSWNYPSTGIPNIKAHTRTRASRMKWAKKGFVLRQESRIAEEISPLMSGVFIYEHAILIERVLRYKRAVHLYKPING